MSNKQNNTQRHTPAPWICRPNGTVDRDASGDTEIIGSPIICTVNNPEKNGALISAAPELFEALRELLDCDYTSGTHLYGAQVKAKRALAKAEGGIS